MLDADTKKTLSKIADTIRGLSIDAVEKAKSGHPGLPMGCAELGAFLYGHALNHNPKNSRWLNRDRLVLSAGHGSMWLYSCLHLAGFNVSLDDLKHFRQLHSRTPGHPEFGHTDGVEATTGPLGQGTGNAVGMALGLKLLGKKFNTDKFTLFDAKVFCLASDGDIMEGVSSEASSLAAHLNLNNLIFFYDSNQVTLDGPIVDCFSEDVLSRFRAYGWDVHEIDGYDFDAMEKIVSKLKEKQTKPAFILMHTIIGKGSPHKEGTNGAHGSPLGPEEAALAKETLGLSPQEFYVPAVIKTYFEKKLIEDEAKETVWQKTFLSWKKAHPDLFAEFEKMQTKAIPKDLEEKLWDIEIKSPIAGRAASNHVLNLLSDLLPYLYGGSADLSTSDMTMMKKYALVSPKNYLGRNIKFGVREFAMGTMASGLALTDMILPFVGTFLTFTDYTRNAIRLACLSKLQVIYHLTHDSIFLGEDGPTHQPIEHYAALRAIPNLQVIRPGDANEVKMAWIAALHYKGPTALLLSRQAIKEVAGTKIPFKEGLGRGGYIIKKEKKAPDFTLFATGSELSLAIDVAEELEKRGKNVRVISMPCFELFEKQPQNYKNQIIGGNLGKRISIEAGVSFGWHKYIGIDGLPISMETFGASAPASDIAKAFGFTVDQIVNKIFD